ncbi:ABC transporter substrate-binding protein [Synechococcus sp. R5-12]|uniref:ABC transporter substrate-binding protein n=1 Tax=Synechococcus sp. R5-12 TaxID=2421321 RepID=UPI0039C732BD
MSVSRRRSLQALCLTLAGCWALGTHQGSLLAQGSDLLAQVQERGVLRISTDSNYRPQSYLNPDGSWEGFDVDVAREIAKRLGVEAEFLDINFDVITAGSWNGRWDVNVGSMTVTAERQKALLFTIPYYYTPASFVVHQASTLTDIAALEGKRVGVGTATTYQAYLEGNLTLEGETIQVPAPRVDIRIYDTDSLALQDLALGDGTRLDAVLTALPTAENAIREGLPLKTLGDPVYYEALAVALDRSSPAPSESLQAKINEILESMHADGTLTALSKRYYGIDLTKKAE